MQPDTLERYRAQLARFEAARGAREPGWLRAARRGALERLAARGLPDQRDEDWKYTSVAPIGRRAYAPATAPRPLAASQLRHLGLPGAHALVFVDGRFAPALSDGAGLPEGVRAVSLALAVPADTGAIEALLADDEADSAGFGALNAAFWSDGAYIELAAAVSLERPLHLLYLSTQAERATYPRTLVRAGAGARATIVEHYAGLGGNAYFTGASTRIVAGAAARIEHIKLQQESARAFHVGAIHVRQEAGSQFAGSDIALGALLARSEIAVALGGEDGAVLLNGLCLASGRQHLDHHSRIEHASARCRSRELYKGVLDDAARAVFHGRVIVHAHAARSDARQVNHHLLLSEQAEADSRPELEIYADEVQCSHGATVGQPDPDHVFYLRARGIDAAAAHSMLAQAFVGEAIGAIASAPVRARVDHLVTARLAARAARPHEEPS